MELGAPGCSHGALSLGACDAAVSVLAHGILSPFNMHAPKPREARLHLAEHVPALLLASCRVSLCPSGALVQQGWQRCCMVIG